MIGTVEEITDRFAAALAVRSGGDESAELLPEVTDGVVGEDVAGTVGVVVPHDRWHDALAYARDGLGLDFFDWLSAVDETDADPAGFDVVVHLAASASFGATAGEGLSRVLVRTRVPEGTPLASATDL